MAEHGTTSRYKNSKCRCDKCRAAHANYMRNWREQKKAEVVAGTVPQGSFAHGISAYVNRGCRCTVCTESFNAYNRARLRKRRRENPEHAKTLDNLKFARRQAETLTPASRHYQEWTGPELEVAARTNLSSRQVALMLGRTFSAVRHVREKLRNDPKTINLAGVESSVADR